MLKGVKKIEILFIVILLTTNNIITYNQNDEKKR
jgi:hypothetical protein